jgi:hypothetical protein
VDQASYWKMFLQLAGTGSPFVSSKNEHGVLATSDSHTSGCPVIFVSRLQSTAPLNPATQLSVYDPFWALVVTRPVSSAQLALDWQTDSPSWSHWAAAFEPLESEPLHPNSTERRPR